MNRKLKSFASNLMLVTGIITSIAGVIETIGKLILSFRTKDLPVLKSMPERSFGMPDSDLPSVVVPDSFFVQYEGLILIVVGILIISFSIFVIKRMKRLK